VENPIPAVVFSGKAARVGNTIPLDYLTSKVAFEMHEIRDTDQNIPINNNCTADELHFVMPGGRGDHQDEGDEIDERDANPTASRPQFPATELERFQLGTSNVNRYDGKDGDDAVADQAGEELQADNGLTQNVDD